MNRIDDEITDVITKGMHDAVKMEQDFWHRKIDIVIKSMQQEKFKDLIYSADQVVAILEALKN